MENYYWAYDGLDYGRVHLLEQTSLRRDMRALQSKPARKLFVRRSTTVRDTMGTHSTNHEHSRRYKPG